MKRKYIILFTITIILISSALLLNRNSVIEDLDIDDSLKELKENRDLSLELNSNDLPINNNNLDSKINYNDSNKNNFDNVELKRNNEKEDNIDNIKVPEISEVNNKHRCKNFLVYYNAYSDMLLAITKDNNFHKELKILQSLNVNFAMELALNKLKEYNDMLFNNKNNNTIIFPNKNNRISSLLMPVIEIRSYKKLNVSKIANSLEVIGDHIYSPKFISQVVCYD